MVTGGYSLGRRASHCSGFLLRSTGSRVHGLPLLWFPGSRAQAQWLWHMGLVALQQMRSSQTRDQTHIFCIGRWILYHRANREALKSAFLPAYQCTETEYIKLANLIVSQSTPRSEHHGLRSTLSEEIWLFPNFNHCQFFAGTVFRLITYFPSF